MPELPEVETIRRRLEEVLPGAKLLRVRVGHEGILEACTKPEVEALRGTIAKPRRHGKYLFLDIADQVLVLHLGMSGQLTWHPEGAPTLDRFNRLPSGYQKPLGPHRIDGHTHLVLECDTGKLLFRDPRRFGRVLLLKKTEIANNARVSKLGPDALDLDAQQLASLYKSSRSSRPVKALLLDQSVVAGVGNIYADEACFTAGILPSRSSQSLPAAKWNRLGEAVVEALDRGIRNAGTTFRDFVGLDGHPGGNQEDLKVYARAGQPCFVCDTDLRKATVAQRGTVWCPKCQK